MEKTFQWQNTATGETWTIAYNEDLTGTVKIMYPNGMPLELPAGLVKAFVVEAAADPVAKALQQFATPETVKMLLGSVVQ